jgi:hypothetical protein
MWYQAESGEDSPGSLYKTHQPQYDVGRLFLKEGQNHAKEKE